MKHNHLARLGSVAAPESLEPGLDVNFVVSSQARDMRTICQLEWRFDDQECSSLGTEKMR